jgi:hypothetical protein
MYHQSALRACKAALSLMTRVSPVKRAPPRATPITAALRRRVVRMWKTTDLSQHMIANTVGLPNAGRVSEIVRGIKRKKRK